MKPKTNRRDFLTMLVLAVLLASCHVCWAGKSRKPNIIYILADDLGYNELGCYGQKWIRTPHIDKIAREGILFTQFMPDPQFVRRPVAF